MDFEPTPESTDAGELAASILADHCTPERLKTADTGRFDRDLWKQLGASGLLALTVPEDHDGSGLGLLELCTVLVEVGRKVAPVPAGQPRRHRARARGVRVPGAEGQPGSRLRPPVTRS